jgi:hypothetical protein
MKIEDGIGIYSLISDLHGLGIFGVILLVWVIAFGSIIFRRKKTMPMSTAITLGIVAFILITISLLLLKKDATRRQALIRLANNVKSEFIVNGFKTMSYDMIWEFNPALHNRQEFGRPDVELLPAEFPTEFAYTVADGLNDNDTLGLQLIDPAALTKVDAYNMNNLGLIKSTIQNYMTTVDTSTLSFRQVRERIDMFYDDEWLELMISQYDSVFVAITRIDPKASRKQMWSQYSDNHFLRLRGKPVRRR